MKADEGRLVPAAQRSEAFHHVSMGPAVKPIAVHAGYGWQSIPAGPRREISEKGSVERRKNGNA